MSENEKKFTVYELEKRPDGSPAGLGPSRECSLEEAVYLIESGEATSGVHPIGVVPPEWLDDE